MGNRDRIVDAYPDIRPTEHLAGDEFQIPPRREHAERLREQDIDLRRRRNVRDDE